MKTKHLLLSILVHAIISCQPVNKDRAPSATDTLNTGKGADLQQEIKGGPVRTALVDSLKWMLYVFNRENKAISEETKNAISPLACDIKLTEVNRKSKDTVEYYFDVFYKNQNERYLFFLTDYIDVGIIKDSIWYILGSHTISDPIPYKVFLSNETLFTESLKKYRGEINKWLKQEAVKRKILEK